MLAAPVSNIENLDLKSFELVSANFDPFHDLQLRAIPIVKQFIIDKNCIIYGGTAIDYALRLHGDKIYSDESLLIPDLDFYSNDSVNQAYELADLLYEQGFSDVRVVRAFHVTTYRIYVGGENSIADITFVPDEVFKSIPTITYENMKIVHPNFQRIDVHLSLSFPYDNPPLENIFHRWSKDIKRFNLLHNYYKLDDTKSILEPSEASFNALNLKLIQHGFSAYALLYTYYKKILEDVGGYIDVKDKLKGIAANEFKITSDKITFNTYDKSLHTINFSFSKLKKFLIDELQLEPLNTLEYFAPIFQLLPKRAEISTDGKKLIVYSTKNRLVSVNTIRFLAETGELTLDDNADIDVYQLMEYSGSNRKIMRVRVVNVQYLLVWLTANTLLETGDKKRGLYIKYYNSILAMIKNLEDIIMQLHKNKDTEHLASIIEKSPFFPSSNTYGYNNHSETYLQNLENLERLLGYEVKATILPARYYTPSKNEEHPKFDYKESTAFYNIGQPIKKSTLESSNEQRAEPNESESEPQSNSNNESMERGTTPTMEPTMQGDKTDTSK